jgi:hypothetical protein
MSSQRHTELNGLLQSLIFASHSPAVIEGETQPPIFYADKIRELFDAGAADGQVREAVAWAVTDATTGGVNANIFLGKGQADRNKAYLDASFPIRSTEKERRVIPLYLSPALSSAGSSR